MTRRWPNQPMDCGLSFTAHRSLLSLPRADVGDELHFGTYVERADFDGRGRGGGECRTRPTCFGFIDRDRAWPAAFLHSDDAHDAPAERLRDGLRFIECGARRLCERLRACGLVSAQDERETVNVGRAR